MQYKVRDSMGKYFIIVGFISAIAGGVLFLPSFLSEYKRLFQTRISLEMKKLKRESGMDEVPKSKQRSIKILCTLQTVTDMFFGRGIAFSLLYILSCSPPIPFSYVSELSHTTSSTTSTTYRS